MFVNFAKNNFSTNWEQRDRSVILHDLATTGMVVQLYYTFRELKGHIFLVVLQEAKKIQKILKSTLRMSVINFWSFSPSPPPPPPPFSETKGNKTCAVSKYVYNPIHAFLQRIKQISDILPISLKNDWSGLKVEFRILFEAFHTLQSLGLLHNNLTETVKVKPVQTFHILGGLPGPF